MAPMDVRLHTHDGYVTDRSVAHYKRMAQGGVGLINLELHVVRPDGAGPYFMDPRISDDGSGTSGPSSTRGTGRLEDGQLRRAPDEPQLARGRSRDRTAGSRDDRGLNQSALAFRAERRQGLSTESGATGFKHLGRGE